MDLLTLDTNILRDWAWCESRSSENRYGNDDGKKKFLSIAFDKLRLARDQGKCEIGVTTQIFTDFHKTYGVPPESISEMIGSHIQLTGPSLSTFPIMFPIVFADKDRIEHILECVFPGADPRSKKHPERRKDALQLYAHRIADRDYFITSDKALLSARVRLNGIYSIIVLALAEYIDILESKDSNQDA